MGVKILSVGSQGAWNNSVLPPVTRGLAGWFDFDTQARRGAFNRALNKAPAGIVGVPQEYATHMGLSPSIGYYQTDIRDTVDLTMFTLMKFRATESAMGPGTYQGPVDAAQSPASIHGLTSYGLSIYQSASGVINYAASRETAAGGAVTSAGFTIADATPGTSWAIRVIRATAARTTAWDKTANKTNQSNIAHPPVRAPSTSPFRIGSPTGSESTYPGTTDVSHVSIFNAALTDAEIDLIVALIRKRAQRLGINA